MKRFTLRPRSPGRCAAALLGGLACVSAGHRAAQASPVQFAVIGDFGSVGNPAHNVSHLVKSWNPQFILTTGDNNYLYGEASTIDANIGQYYHEFIAPYTGAYGAGAADGENHFFPSMGNHDWYSGSAAHTAYFTLPGNERYYATRQGPVEFFIIDSNANDPDLQYINKETSTQNSVQGRWLRQQMRNSDARWKVVVFHHPPYSSGQTHGSQPFMRWPFEEWGADAVLAGHEHFYERLRSGDTAYIINGLGGYPGPYAFRATPLPESQVRYRADYGAQRGTAADDSLRLEFISLSAGVVDDYNLISTPRAMNPAITTGYWHQAAMWMGGTVPGEGDEAFLRSADAVNRTITYVQPPGSAVRLRRVHLDGRGGGTVTCFQQQDLLWARDLRIAEAEGANAVFQLTGGTVDVARVINGGTFTQTGGTLRLASSFTNIRGTATLSGTQQWEPGAQLRVEGGVVNLNRDLGGAVSAHISGGELIAGPAMSLARIDMTGGKLTLAPAGAHLMVISGISLVDARIDIGGGTLIVHGGSDPAGNYQRVLALAASGRNQGDWDGPLGIISADVAAATDGLRGIGVMWNRNAQGNPIYTTFMGRAVNATSTLVRYAFNGDANLSGTVTADDYFLIDAGFGSQGTPSPGSGWFNGDFNYDGRIDIDDYFLIDSAYTRQAGPQAASPASIPEPSVALIAAAARLVLGHRRRNRG